VTDYTTLLVDVRDGVAHVTLNRPQVHNAFDAVMQSELAACWQALRGDDAVRAVLLTGAGDRAFCTGIDRSLIPEEAYDPYTYEDPGKVIGPKARGLWKPVVAAVNGMACGGAFYLLGESDVILASETATFFDPHVTYGMPAVYEPILMTGRMMFGDLARMSLLGAAERMSAETALRSGLVTEVTPPGELLERATWVAESIAAQPPAAVQATLRTLWAARNLTPDQGLALGNVLLGLGSGADARLEGQQRFAQGAKAEWRLR
jgi:enoyl-CoA hydratase/carnithine racemase